MKLQVVLILLLSAPSLPAHGGTYRGPRVPPVVGIPSGPPPGGPTRRPGAGARGGATPTIDVRLWETWWGHNREEFFPIRGVRPGQGAEEPYEGQARPPTRRQVRRRIIPALLEALADRDREIRNSAAIALGRVGEEPELAPLLRALQDRERSVVEAAIIGLGLLRCEPAEDTLAEIVRDARRSARERGLALMALGFSGGENARRYLLDGLGRPRTGRRERSAHLATLQAMAAGLMEGRDLPGADPSRPSLTTSPLLRGIARGTIKERFFLPTAFVALSKTRGGAARKEVLAGLAHRKTEVRAGAAIALGRVLRKPSRKTLTRIRRILSGEGDRFTRRLILISLGRIGTDGAREILRANLRHNDRQHRAFAILALAIAGDRDMVPVFRRELKSAGDQSLKGALAIALGLLRDRESGKVLVREMRSNKNPALRSHLAQALLLLGDRANAGILEETFAGTSSVDLQASTALSMGLLGAPSSTRLLLERLSPSKTIAVKGAIATGLGRSGDQSIIEPLLRFVRDEKEQDLSRAFGVIALGLLGEKEPSLSPFARVAIDSQYALRIPVLDELRDLL